MIQNDALTIYPDNTKARFMLTATKIVAKDDKGVDKDFQVWKRNFCMKSGGQGAAIIDNTLSIIAKSLQRQGNAGHAMYLKSKAEYYMRECMMAEASVRDWNQARG